MKSRQQKETCRRWYVAAALMVSVLILTVVGVGAQAEDPATKEVAAARPVVYPADWNDMWNGSFEQGESEPYDWYTQSYVPGAVFKWVKGQAVDGDWSVMISHETENDSRWLQEVDVEPNTDYVLSGWIKTRNVGHTSQTNDAGANLSILGLWDQTPPLFGTNGWTHVSVTFNSGNHSELFIYARLGHFSGVATGTAWFDDIRLIRVRPLYVSSTRSGTVGGVHFTSGDILVHNPVRDTWAMYFDASDVGIRGNVVAFDVWPWSLYGDENQSVIRMSLAMTQHVSGVGRVTPWDVIQFTPTSTGPDTAGTFKMFQAGRDIGLSTAGERIDAIGPVAGPSGHALTLSTVGSAWVPEDPFGWWDDDTILNARDEDIIGFCYYDDWWYAPDFDGSAVPGLAEDDVIAADVAERGGPWFLTIQGSGIIANRPYNQKDIFIVAGDKWSGYTVLGTYWHGPDHGFNYYLDAIDIGDE